MGCDSTQRSMARVVTLIGTLPCLGEGVGGFDGRLKCLAVRMVIAEMLNCKLLSIQAPGIKHLDFT